ncbi:MAG TPA: CHC2 zinc finger domain-containing protein, partial [Methanosarcinales archaeon]|nr:CHC2 zinc finger domain-containing protein [Methanosarcinales archaeon]
MANRKKLSKGPRGSDIYKAKKSLWLAPGVEWWIAYLKTIDSSRIWRRSDSRSIKALCPFHSESNPSFIIDLEKGRARCYGCNVHFADPIKFLSELSKSPYKNTLERVIKDFPRIPPIFKEEMEEVTKRHQHNVLKNHIYRIAKECLADARAARSSGDEEKLKEF